MLFGAKCRDYGRCGHIQAESDVWCVLSHPASRQETANSTLPIRKLDLERVNFSPSLYPDSAWLRLWPLLMVHTEAESGVAVRGAAHVPEADSRSRAYTHWDALSQQDQINATRLLIAIMAATKNVRLKRERGFDAHPRDGPLLDDNTKCTLCQICMCWHFLSAAFCNGCVLRRTCRQRVSMQRPKHVHHRRRLSKRLA